MATAAQRSPPLPRFRGDLTIEPRPGGTFLVRSPAKPQGFLLYDLELSLARLLDGARGMEEVLAEARRLTIPATQDSLTKFLRQLWQYGFLETPQPAPQPFHTVSKPEAFSDRDVVMRLWTENKPDEALSYLEMLVGRNPDDQGLMQLLDLLRAQREADLKQPAPPPSAPAPAEAPAPVVAAPAPIPVVPAAPPPTGVADQERPDAIAREAVEGDPENVARRTGRGRRRRLLTFGAVAIALAVGAVLPVSLTITEPCTLVPSRRAVLRSTGGLVEKVAVKEGQEVKEGDLLVKLSDFESRNRVESIEAELTKAKVAIELSRRGAKPEEIDRAKKALQSRQREASVAGRTLGRKRALFSQQMVPRDELDAAEAEYVARQGAASEAESQLKLLLAGPSKQELARLEADLKGIETRLSLAKASLDATTLVSPITGRVATPRVEEQVGTMSQVGQSLIEVIDTTKMRVEVFVPQAHLDVLKPGLPVVVKVPNLPDQRFSGKVSFISLVVERRGDPPAEFVRVDSEIDNPTGELMPNMTGYAEIRAGNSTVAGVLWDRLGRWLRFRFT